MSFGTFFLFALTFGFVWTVCQVAAFFALTALAEMAVTKQKAREIIDAAEKHDPGHA